MSSGLKDRLASTHFKDVNLDVLTPKLIYKMRVGVAKVNPVAFDCATGISGDRKAVAFDIKECIEWDHSWIYGNDAELSP